ncbi:MAG: leucyl/phenylalanyl-tRNA--protein transferase [Planctomycetota bacterium]|jgi:leucyl/phenylalanyl-tRNA--protein transferase
MVTEPPLPPDVLVRAYRRGIFPMADPITGRLEWYRPDPRAVIPLDDFRVRPSLRRVVRSGRFEVVADRAFEAVMRACAEPRGDDDLPWIDERLVRAYAGLHGVGLAHSVEARRGGRLVGGLYGVAIGAAFCGESMFVRPEAGGTDASKVCLVHLVRWLRHRGYTLLDTQFTNPHLLQFGCVEIPAAAYLARLADAVDRDVTWGEFEPLDED